MLKNFENWLLEQNYSASTSADYSGRIERLCRNEQFNEHDFGSFDYNGEKIYWKIDYYDKSYQYLSENPANPEVTNRVLTVMLADEY